MGRRIKGVVIDDSYSISINRLQVVLRRHYAKRRIKYLQQITKNACIYDSSMIQ